VTTATTVGAGGRAAARGSRVLGWLGEWIKGHRQAVGYLGAGAVLAAGLFAWYLLSARTAERNAGRELEQGRLAWESKNYALAASVLSHVIENYASTHAAEEGHLLLAQVRLAQGQWQQAIAVLTRFAPRADKNFQAQAYGLLGAAYENAGRARDAATAYERAADVALYPFLRAQFLSDAGRAWVAAGDTGRALGAYRTIVEKLDSTAGVTEAKVRIGELTRGAGLKLGAGVKP
jgi:tetratricopeptide (TPR) repeat protein